jgi:hypothetical protein
MLTRDKEPMAEMSDEIPLPNTCLNCGVQVDLNFCPNCGQEHTTMIVPIGHLLRDVVDEFILLDSKLLRTLKLLILRPGFLTNEYVAGRRIRYVSPFRLYFVISAIYFLAFSFAHYDVAVMHGLAYGLEQAHHAHATDEEAPVKMLTAYPADGMHTMHLGHNIHTVPDRARRHRLAVDRTSNWFLKNQSLITFLLVPIAALLLKLLYLGTRRLYIEHLVFAVHLQSFMFALLLPALLPYGRSLTYILAFALSALYLFIAMRTAYRQSIAVTIAKGSAMLAGYLVLMIATAYTAFLVFYDLA